MKKQFPYKVVGRPSSASGADNATREVTDVHLPGSLNRPAGRKWLRYILSALMFLAYAGLIVGVSHLAAALMGSYLGIAVGAWGVSAMVVVLAALLMGYLLFVDILLHDRLARREGVALKVLLQLSRDVARAARLDDVIRVQWVGLYFIAVSVVMALVALGFVGLVKLGLTELFDSL